MRDFSDKYLALLTGPYAGINLTRVTDEEEFYHKQILDSIGPIEASSVFKKSIESTGVYVDIGFGGGFPLLPLAHKFPDVQFIGFEARAKKANVVGEIAKELGLKNVKTYHQRFEDVLVDTPAVFSFKAVGKIKALLKGFQSKEAIQVYFYKGPNMRELEVLNIKGWKVIEEKEIKVEGTEGRIFIGFEGRNVPCRTGKLVRLSKLVNNNE